MKRIDSWKDTNYRVTNQLYELKNGIKVLLTENPRTIDFDFAVIINAGNFYEDKIGVPQGTAHFLEHIMYGNPNKVFKTREAMNKYEYGSKNRPSIYFNAATGDEHISFYAHGNEKGAERMINSVFSRIDYPLENIKKYLEKERKIISGELQRKNKEERSTFIQYSKFIWGDVYPELTKVRLGTSESLKKISETDLVKFYKTTFNSKNIIIAIQSRNKLTPKLKKAIKQFEKLEFSSKKKLKVDVRRIAPKFNYKHFEEDNSRSVFFSINHVYDLDLKKINYKINRLSGLTSSFIYKLGHEYLREKKGLIYDLDSLNFQPTPYQKIRGFSLSCELSKLKEVFDESITMYTHFYKDFLNSKDGEKWLNDTFSHEIFKRNTDHDSEYAETEAKDVLDDTLYWKFDFKKAKKAALEITKDDLIEFFEKFVKIKPYVWFVSPYKQEDVYTEFKKSKFFEHYSKP